MSSKNNPKESKNWLKEIFSFLKHLAEQKTVTARLIAMWWATVTLLPIACVLGLAIGLVTGFIEPDHTFKLIDKGFEWAKKIHQS